jgi:hypothetical protein
MIRTTLNPGPNKAVIGAVILGVLHLLAWIVMPGGGEAGVLLAFVDWPLFMLFGENFSSFGLVAGTLMYALIGAGIGALFFGSDARTKLTSGLSRKWKFRFYLIVFVSVMLLAVTGTVVGILIPKYDSLSFLIITTPVEGRVINGLTGEPIPNAEISGSIGINTFHIFFYHGEPPMTYSWKMKSYGLVSAGPDGHYYLPRYFLFKWPLFQKAGSSGQEPGSDDYFQLITFRFTPGSNLGNRVYFGDDYSFSKGSFAPITYDGKIMPIVVNPSLCDNPGGSYRPDPKTIKKCLNDQWSMVLNNRPESCMAIECPLSDCDEYSVDRCKQDLATLWQNVKENDDCIRKKNQTNDDFVNYLDESCLMAKAIKFKEPKYCNAIYEYNMKENGKAGEAPSIFSDYFNFGIYSDLKMSYKDACILMVAYQAGNTAICNQITEGNEEEWQNCIFFAMQKNLKTIDEWNGQIIPLFK